MRSVTPPLPEFPEDRCEFEYASLLFDTHCMVCQLHNQQHLLTLIPAVYQICNAEKAIFVSYLTMIRTCCDCWYSKWVSPFEDPSSLYVRLTLNSFKTGVDLSQKWDINDDERIQAVIFNLLPGEIFEPCMLLKCFESTLVKELIRLPKPSIKMFMWK